MQYKRIYILQYSALFPCKKQPYGTEPFTSYQSSLTKYVIGAREKGAVPVFITSVHRRSFDENGRLVNTLGDYPNAMIQLSKKLGVQLIDLWSKTGELYQSLGPERSKKLFMWLEPNCHPNYPNGIQDNTHFCEEGAKQIAKLVVEGIKEIRLPISMFILE